MAKSEPSAEFLKAKQECLDKFGAGAAVWTDKGGVVLRPPSFDEYNRASDAAVKAQTALTAAVAGANKATNAMPITSVKRQYVNGCLFYPRTTEEAVPIFERYPGLVHTLVRELDKMSGEEFEPEILGN